MRACVCTRASTCVCAHAHAPTVCARAYVLSHKAQSIKLVSVGAADANGNASHPQGEGEGAREGFEGAPSPPQLAPQLSKRR